MKVMNIKKEMKSKAKPKILLYKIASPHIRSSKIKRNLYRFSYQRLINHISPVRSTHPFNRARRKNTYNYITLRVSHFLGRFFPYIVKVVTNIDTFLFRNHINVVTLIHHFSARLRIGVTVAWRWWHWISTHFCSKFIFLFFFNNNKQQWNTQ